MGGGIPTTDTREVVHVYAAADTERRLRQIAAIIEAVDERCLAVDGPVTPTRQEITDKEMQRIYKLAKGK